MGLRIERLWELREKKLVLLVSEKTVLLGADTDSILNDSKKAKARRWTLTPVTKGCFCSLQGIMLSLPLL